MAFDNGGVEGLEHRQKKSLSKLALEVRVETSRSLRVKFGMTGLLRRDQKDIEERRLNKAAFKERW